MKFRSFLFLLATWVLPQPVIAQEPPHDLPPGLSDARLLAGWTKADGTRITALELTLEPGWKTYWRVPGDGGIPPEFDWAQSDNLRSMQLLWPRPKVIKAQDERTLGYQGRVILPIEVTPEDPAKPVQIRLDVQLGLCLNICVPALLRLEAAAPDTQPDAVIEAAINSAPKVIGTMPSCEIRPTDDGMQVTAHFPAGLVDAHFAAALELGDETVWVSEPVLEPGQDGFAATSDFVPVSGAPFDLDPATLRLTLIDDARAVEMQGCAQIND